MIKVTDKHNPGFYLLATIENRSAWRPVKTNTILVVPHNDYDNSDVSNVKVFIENVPRMARVAGHQHVGLFSPDRELFSQSLTKLDLLDRLISFDDIIITRDDEEISIDDAITGDIINLTTRSGIADSIEYVKNAVYYDLSDVEVETEILPSDIYNLAYYAEYYKRITTSDVLNEFICIDQTITAIALSRFVINHPGDVIENFHNLTTDVALTSANKSQDQVIGLYRPITDIFQDIHDEQDLLEQVNWVFDTPPEIIPYMSVLLGWDLPYYPKSLDSLRRAILRRTVEFQKLRGSRRAIINLFKLFGFEILISNLWWSEDGKRLIRPGEILPEGYRSQEITIAEEHQFDILLDGILIENSTSYEVPLLYRPQQTNNLDDFDAIRDGGSITIEAYLVEADSESDEELQQLVNDIGDDPKDFGKSLTYSLGDGGNIQSNILTAINSLDIICHDTLVINGDLGKATEITNFGPVKIISEDTISFNREQNVLNITIGDTFEYKLYVFAIYKKQELIIPSLISDLQSNRFDIQVVKEDLKSFVDPITLEFAIELLQKVRAFHSLLRAVRQTAEFDESYLVTDLCVGGDFTQRHDTDLGRFQVPPAIIPIISEDCQSLTPEAIGYKTEDINYRLRIILNTIAEFDNWKALDGREATVGGTKLAIDQPHGDECQFNYKGQDRTLDDSEAIIYEHNPSPIANQHYDKAQPLSPIDSISNGDFDPYGLVDNSNKKLYGLSTVEFTEPGDTYCDQSGDDYCYKGRVADNLLSQNKNINSDSYWSSTCILKSGFGLYWTFPSYSKEIFKGVKKPTSNSRRPTFTGSAKSGNIQQYTTDIQNNYLSAEYDQKISKKSNSHLGKLYQKYSRPLDSTIHYGISESSQNQLYYLALQRPSLEIYKPLMHFPGCRFPTMAALPDDYISTDIDARPWDIDLCGPSYKCGNAPTNYLNAIIETDEDGNENLIFDSESYSLTSNGLTADISSLGSHSLGSMNANDIVHKVYATNSVGHPAIELDGVCDISDSGGTASDGFINVADKLFNSATDCGTSFIDYADGYACDSGYFTYTFTETSTDYEVMDGLGVPYEDVEQTLLFRLNSGIIDGSVGVRLDCGCLNIECNGTEITSVLCDPNIGSDWAPDQLDIDYYMHHEEDFGVCDYKLNGSIPTLLETF